MARKPATGDGLLSSVDGAKEAEISRRIRIWLGMFIAGLVVSGITAFPLENEVSVLVSMAEHLQVRADSERLRWLCNVDRALTETNLRYPFLAYGTDWLAFAHLVIATGFIGAWIDPVRNRWLLTFGLIACAGVIPLALIAGAVRGVPLYWRFLDCSFGILGAIPLI
jgi:hypothetical protein